MWKKGYNGINWYNEVSIPCKHCAKRMFFWFFRQNLPLWTVKVDRVPLKKQKKIVYRPTVTGFRQSSIYTFIWYTNIYSMIDLANLLVSVPSKTPLLFFRSSELAQIGSFSQLWNHPVMLLAQKYYKTFVIFVVPFMANEVQVTRILGSKVVWRQRTWVFYVFWCSARLLLKRKVFVTWQSHHILLVVGSLPVNPQNPLFTSEFTENAFCSLSACSRVS